MKRNSKVTWDGHSKTAPKCSLCIFALLPKFFFPQALSSSYMENFVCSPIASPCFSLALQNKASASAPVLSRGGVRVVIQTVYRFTQSHSCVVSLNLYNTPNEEMEHQKGSAPKIKIKGQSSDRDQVRLALKSLSLSPKYDERSFQVMVKLTFKYFGNDVFILICVFKNIAQPTCCYRRIARVKFLLASGRGVLAIS